MDWKLPWMGGRRRMDEGQAVNGTDQEPAQPVVETRTIRENFEQRFRRGEYLGMLETYKVAWNQEKVARDIWQNFFDGAGGTVDGVGFQVEEIDNGQEQKTEYRVTISGDANYDYRKLLHFGGTSKAEDTETAGGFGEGTKVSALVMLRDFGVSGLKFRSTGWEIGYYLDDIPEESYDEQGVKGLYAKLSDGDDQPGNSVEITTTEHDLVEQLWAARDLFYHSENEDFKDPNFISKSGYGFKYLGPKSNGHLYDAGQRRHFDSANKGWDNVEGLHIWSKLKKFGGDRDRGAVSRYDVEKEIIKPMIEEANPEELVQIVEAMRENWSNGYHFEVCSKVLLDAVKAMAKIGVKMDFGSEYLADDIPLEFGIKDRLREQGYILCFQDFKNIGMKSAKEKFISMQEHIAVEPTPEQRKKADILAQAASLVCQVLDKEKRGDKLAPKDIWIYSKKDEKNIITGQYNEKFVWLCEEMFDESFAKALATYLHELDHKFGTDQSAEFSYALTDTMEFVIEAMSTNPNVFRELRERWGQTVETAE